MHAPCVDMWFKDTRAFFFCVLVPFMPRFLWACLRRLSDRSSAISCLCTSMMHRASFLLCSVGCGQQHWIHNHAIEQMNCASVFVDVDGWDAFAQFLDSPMDPRPKMIQLASELQDILIPFDVADPVIALQCPLGVSAAFHQLAMLCLLVSADCAQRALRLLHLSKLFTFFSYTDFGLWFGDARWGDEPAPGFFRRVAGASSVFASAKRRPLALWFGVLLFRQCT